MLVDIMNQTERAARLLERAANAAHKVRGLRSGDRVYTPLVASAEFPQGSAPSQNLIFNVPADADFWAYRLLIYPFCKVVDPVNLTPDEIVFRPTSFSGQPAAPGAQVATGAEGTWTDFNSTVDGMFALMYDGKEMQNTDVPMSAAYCVDVGKWIAQNNFSQYTFWTAASQNPAGLVFDVPFFIPRGRAITLRVTPTYLGVRTIVETITVVATPTEITRQHRYKIVAVLEGEKKVTAFR